MYLENLLRVLPEYYTVVDHELVKQAYLFAENAHQNQKRLSGEPYITHVVAVATILAELKVPSEVIIAALLHDVVEDTDVTLKELEQKFGQEISSLVDGVTKLTNLPRVSRDNQKAKIKNNEEQSASDINTTRGPKHGSLGQDRELAAETLRKTLMAMGDDVRVVLIKLADRLHNMRTLSFIPEEKKLRIAQETVDIFAPLANRLGIWQIKWELEDLSFRYIEPVVYKEIAAKLAERRNSREEEIKIIINDLTKIMREANIDAQISGRPKHLYSIYKKMQKKDKPFEMLRDLRGVRLIVPDIPSCYAALGLVHNHWRPIPNEFDDYIAAPKDNFYQSLHTAVLYSDGKTLEVQIRTQKMDENAEYGIAAHWRYKEKGPLDESYQQRVNWLRKIMDWRQDVDDAQDFVDGMKTDVFEDRVYIFTPKGDIIDLPSGSTPIDFAYHVHTEIGHRCRGAKVNRKLVSLDHQLKTGDQVEVLTAKHGGPSRDWLNTHLGLVKTQRARAKIRQWFKKQDLHQNINQGRVMIEKELHRLGIEGLTSEEIYQLFDFKDKEGFFEAIGCGDISIRRIVNKIKDVEKEGEEPLLDIPHAPPHKTQTDAVNVLGLRGLLTHFAKCCNPAPGDEIIGYITRGRGATIHRKDCPNIFRMKDKERMINVSWGEAQKTFPVTVQIKAYDRQGLMKDISTILSNEGANLRDINLKINNNQVMINLELEINDISQLSRILNLTETLPNVMEAYRVKPG